MTDNIYLCLQIFCVHFREQIWSLGARGVQGGHLKADFRGLHGSTATLGQRCEACHFEAVAAGIKVRVSLFTACWRGGGTPFVAAGHLGTRAPSVDWLNSSSIAQAGGRRPLESPAQGEVSSSFVFSAS